MANKKFFQGVDLQKNEIVQAVLQNSNGAVATPSEGQVWYDTSDDHPYVRDATTNKKILLEGDVSGDPSAVTRTTAAGAAGELTVSGGADRTIETYAGSEGIIKVDASGVASTATAGTDYITEDSTNTLTNKTFDANGTGNSISNIEVADFATGVIDTDISSVSATDDTLASSKSIKTYVDSVAAGYGQFIGDLDASAGVPTTGSGPAGEIEKGDYWRISVAGTITGVTPESILEVGDVLVAKIDEASLGADFFSLQGNITGAVTNGGTSTDNRIARFDGTTGNVIQNSSATLDDSGNLSGVVDLTVTGTTTLADTLTGVLRADSGVVGVDTDVTDLVTAASTTAQGKVELATLAEAEAKTDTERALTAASVANFAKMKVITVTTDGLTGTYQVVHNFGKDLSDLSVELRDGTTGEKFEADVNIAASDVTNQFDVTTSPNYPAGSYKAIVIAL